MSGIQSEKAGASNAMDIEKNTPSSSSVNVDVLDAESRSFDAKPAWWKKILSLGVEERGIQPVPVEERTDDRFVNIFSIWFTMSINCLPVVTGMLGTFIFGLNLRDASLIIIFLTMTCSLVVAFLSVLGPKTGLRQLIQARYSFGIVGAAVLVVLNLATITGFVIIGSVLGGSTLAAVNPGSISVEVSIVILNIIALFISFCGYKVLHQFERYSWIPSLIALIIATGYGGKNFTQAEVEPAATSTIVSFAGVVAGFVIPWGALASDFAIYIRPDAPSKRIFAYTYLGLCVPTVLLMILGAAMGGAIANNPTWADGYASHSVGGVLAAVLIPGGRFGQFVTVLIAFSGLGNMAASLYSISLNFQILHPVLMKVPRPIYAIFVVAISIGVSIAASRSFFAALENFIYLIAYWSAAFISVVITEHVVFRKMNCDSYDHAIWDDITALPTGIAALAAAGASFGVVAPCMSQVWYTGPIAKTTGDIGFEVALVVSGLLYVPFRMLEIKLRGRL